jgi:hypothetical protein
MTQTGGPSLGGALVQLFGASATLLFDVGSYLMSASLLARIPGRSQPTRAAGPTWAAVREGLWYA